jgi:hypothetical protein
MLPPPAGDIIQASILFFYPFIETSFLSETGMLIIPRWRGPDVQQT